RRMGASRSTPAGQDWSIPRTTRTVAARQRRCKRFARDIRGVVATDWPPILPALPRPPRTSVRFLHPDLDLTVEPRATAHWDGAYFFNCFRHAFKRFSRFELPGRYFSPVSKIVCASSHFLAFISGTPSLSQAATAFCVRRLSLG